MCKNPELRLGVRVTAQGLVNKQFHEICQLEPKVYKAFTFTNVVEYMVKKELASKGDSVVFCLVLRLDEFPAK